MTVPDRILERLSIEQERLALAVDVLALEEGGSTEDIIRSSQYSPWPGCVLTALVASTSEVPGDINDEEKTYVLRAEMPGDGETTESIAVHADGVAITDFFGAELYGLRPVPDYAIASFFDRHGIDILLDSLGDTE